MQIRPLLVASTLFALLMTACTAQIQSKGTRNATDETGESTDTSATDRNDSEKQEPTPPNPVDPSDVTVLSVTGVNSLAARTGDTVEIYGSGFDKFLRVSLSGQLIVPRIISKSLASFTMPALAAGRVEVAVSGKRGTARSFVILSDAASDNIPISLADAGMICSDTSYRDASGQVRTGTRDCSPAAPSIPTCTENASDCYLPAYNGGSQPLKALDASAISAGVIKRGVTIAGVQGQFPSANHPLPRYSSDDASVTTEIAAGGVTTSLTDFSGQATSAGSFEFWDGSGRRYTGAGDEDLVNANIKSGVNLESFGLVGNFSGSGGALLSVWDVRAGIDRGDGEYGKLKVNCRNVVDNTYYNYDGDVTSITNTSVNSGTTFDWWDTVDDYYGMQAATHMPSVWVADENYCGGVAADATDDKVWLDVTTGGCSAGSCRFQDKISGLQWSKLVTSKTWAQAVNECDALSMDGFNDWRLPTQKELHAAYTHGLGSAANADFFPAVNVNSYAWSASSNVLGPAQAWGVRPSDGMSIKAVKTTNYNVFCVRN